VLMGDLATLVNQFAYPVALKKITWKTYIVFVIWCPIQALVIYFFIPETKGRTVSFPNPNWRKVEANVYFCDIARRVG
jgi:hypothetical protein